LIDRFSRIRLFNFRAVHDNRSIQEYSRRIFVSKCNKTLRQTGWCKRCRWSPGNFENKRKCVIAYI